MADAARGVAYLDAAIENAPKLVDPSILGGRVAALWDSGLPSGYKTGWPSVDKHYTVAPGQMTIVTGWPGSGKSEWLDALLVNLCRQDWRIGMFSPENQPIELHASKWLEKITGKPFGRGPTERMTREEALQTAGKLANWMRFLEPPKDGGVSALGVIKAFEPWFRKHEEQPCGLVIDPWNELEHWRPANLSETEYVSQTLSTVRNWARSSGVHVWIVAHPQKMRRDDGKLPIPRPDMISGSQHWWNKADAAITVWRDMEDLDKQEVEIHVQKVRFKNIGRPGLVSLRYDRVTGRYHELEPEWRGLSRVVP